ncbi:MAG: Long-chain-fatty-acid--CoA ligase [Deltaproteobacteria bacterium]|nr:Long-chain-fatty-acid--CoA ligase [Deltaproteobacteria bacterium]
MYNSNYLVHHLRASSAGREDTTFIRLHETDDIISYGEFFENVERIASALVSAGIQPGDRVAMQVEKSPTALELYIGSILAGACFLPLNTAYVPDEIDYFLRDAQPALFVCDPEQLGVMSKIASKNGVSNVWTLSAENTGSLIDARNAESSGFNGLERGPDDLAALLYTSGTTGRSKGAMLTHRNLQSNADALVKFWSFTEQDVLIHALPLFHTHGLFVATNVAMLSGSSMILMKKFDADAICQRMPQASVLMGVPTFYVRLLEHPDLKQAAKNMRLFASGSAPMLFQTHADWYECTGHAILERYGMTECGMSTSNPYKGERRAGTAGVPLPGIEVIVTDPESGQHLPQGETGMLEVRGPNVFKGYWGMQEKTQEELRENGFLITGDLGTISEDGYVSLVGRSKDLIISGGYNIYPKEVEALLDDIEGVYESAVIGIQHPDFGEAVAAVIVTQPGINLNQDSIMDVLQNRIARFKQPKQIILIDELPRNTMGKVQKNVLRENYKDIFQGKS